MPQGEVVLMVLVTKSLMMLVESDEQVLFSGEGE